MSILIISCSLHPQSRSYVLARQIEEALNQRGAQSAFFDLRDLELDFCDATRAQHTPDAKRIIAAIESASTVLLAAPVYNYDLNAAAKNLLEIGLRAWNHKLVGFLCAAGGRNSYMSVMSFANSLMLDFRCIVIPRFVYATGSDFDDDRLDTMVLSSPVIEERIQELAETTIALTTALAPIYGVNAR